MGSAGAGATVPRKRRNIELSDPVSGALPESTAGYRTLNRAIGLGSSRSTVTIDFVGGLGAQCGQMFYSGADDLLGYSGGARRCWNRQTGQTQTLLSERTCGFKSHPPYQIEATEALRLALISTSSASTPLAVELSPA